MIALVTGLVVIIRLVEIIFDPIIGSIIDPSAPKAYDKRCFIFPSFMGILLYTRSTHF